MKSKHTQFFNQCFGKEIFGDSAVKAPAPVVSPAPIKVDADAKYTPVKGLHV